MLHGYSGVMYGYGFFKGAYADVYDDGSVEITLYASGDAYERQHYYNEPGSYNIHDAIYDAIVCEDREHYSYSPKKFRREIAKQIQRIICEESEGV